MNTLRNRVCWILIIQCCWSFNNLLSQEVTTFQWKGERYYVYPTGHDLAEHEAMYQAQRFDWNYLFHFKRYWKENIDYEYSNREFRNARRRYFFSAFTPELSRSLRKAIRKNSDPLLEPNYSFEKDVIPNLDPLPDGKYIQFFNNYSYLTRRGRSVFVDSIPSGIFTLKNNILDGQAYWLDVNGDTLKTGLFVNGLKEGIWLLEKRDVSYYLSKKSMKMYTTLGHPEVDTIIEIQQFKGGSKEGEYAYYKNSVHPIMTGIYRNNVPAGNWTERLVTYTGFGKNKKLNRNNERVTTYYTLAEKPVAVKQVLIRENFVYDGENDSFNFAPKFFRKFNFWSIYDLNRVEEENIELDEESFNSYDEESYEEEFEYNGEMDYEEDDYGQHDGTNELIYDNVSGEYVGMYKLRDSLGIRMLFDGVYTKNYPNGKKMLSYQFKEGKLISEDTVFWDNGTPYDIISFDKDSNQYIRTVNDYDGKLYLQAIYDSIGKFIRYKVDKFRNSELRINGFLIEDRDRSPEYLFYNGTDSLKHEILDSTVLFATWSKLDTALIYLRTYVPSERRLDASLYSSTQNNYYHTEVNFSDNFEGWTGTHTYRLGNMEIRKTISATILDEIIQEKDTIDQQMVNSYLGSFTTQSDLEYFVDGKLFTGPFEMSVSGSNFRVSTGNKLDFQLPIKIHSKRLQKKYERYKKGKKLSKQYQILLGSTYPAEYKSDYTYEMVNQLLDDKLKENVDFQEFEGGVSLKGFIKDGKPTGIWKILNNKGVVVIELPYINGALNGTLKIYEKSLTQSETNGYPYNQIPENFRDSFPKRPVYFCSYESEFKNDLQNGTTTKYDWQRKIIEQGVFKDGWQEGEVIQRSKVAFSITNYENGELDGYAKTYLTLPGKDSLLLYDLDFQNGLLQGESKAYHLNGKLAKRGFFLNGQAIEDYEAFDTLGFKYQYVKFEYGYPVEEKIWEENQLSVRYLFDWRDSIPFQPYDITMSESLDDLLPELGIGMDYYERPYYGRPSLINKSEVDYHITKYYSNDSIARDGQVQDGKKVGCWKYYNYYGEFLYEVDYFDTVLVINDSIKFKAKGILTDYNAAGKKLSESFVIEKFEKYDCSHSDHYEIRQLMTFWQNGDTVDRMNGYVKNYYDNGVLQNEGNMKNGFPTGVWKFYDPYGKLNKVGNYVMGKRDGRWLMGDLSKTKYLGEICLNPNLPDLEEELKYREKLLDIEIVHYRLGKSLNKEFYDINLNDEEATAEHNRSSQEIYEDGF